MPQQPRTGPATPASRRPDRAGVDGGQRHLTGRAAGDSGSAPDEPLEFETTTEATSAAEEIAGADEASRRERLHHSAWWWIRAAAITVTLFAAWQLLLIVQSWVSGLLTVILFVIFGSVVSFAASPVMKGLQRWAHFPHLLAVLTSLLLVVLLVAGLGYLVAGPLASEISGLVRQAPSIANSVQTRLNQIQQALNAHGISVGGGTSLSNLLGTTGSSLASHLGTIVITGVTGVITGVVDTAIVLVTAFWLLNDGPALRRSFLQTLPGRAREHAEFALDATQVVIGGYVRAQLVLAFVIGTLAWAGCTGLGVPFPIVVGVAAGTFELVPLLGPFLGGTVGVALALTRSPVLALWTVVLFIAIHIIEGYILAPRIQARFIQLHPLVAFLALIAGIEVDGLLGALFAIPAASLAAVFLRASIGDWRANRPEMFQASVQDAYLERRRRSLLRDFRLMKRSPSEVVQRHGPVAWIRRARGEELPPEEPDPADEDTLDPRSG